MFDHSGGVGGFNIAAFETSVDCLRKGLVGWLYLELRKLRELHATGSLVPIHGFLFLILKYP